MLTIWNRRELCITSSMRSISEVRNVLAANHIDYIVKTEDRALARTMLEPNRIPFGNQQHILYSVFVHKKDLEQAHYLIRDISFHDGND